MNLQKITEFYPWDDSTSTVGGGEDSLRGQFTLCLDRISGSGEFAFVYILLNLIKQGVHVKLIVCNHSKTHYTSIFRKNNLDISKLEQTGKLEMILLTDNTDGEEKGVYNWEGLKNWQESILSTSTNPVAILLDDLDMLELLAPSAAAARGLVTQFLASLQPIASSSSSARDLSADTGVLSHVVAFGRHPQETTAQLSSLGTTGGSSNGSAGGVVATNSENGDATGLGGAYSAVAAHSAENDQPALCEYLRYRADVTIVVSALGTGYSSAVHGVITTTQRQQLPRRQTLQYKALDSGVLCALVGASF